MFLTGEVEQGPGAPGEHDTVDVDIILDDVLELVVRLVERPTRQGGEGSLGSSPISMSWPHGLPRAGLRAPGRSRGQGGRFPNGVEHLRGSGLAIAWM